MAGKAAGRDAGDPGTPAAPALDRLQLRGLRLRCIVGVREEERRLRREVILTVTLHADLREACRGDRLEHTVDYSALAGRIEALVEGSSFQLIEALAEAVAQLCLREERVQRVEVLLEKPGALRSGRAAAVQILRER